MFDLAAYKKDIENKILDAIVKGLNESNLTPEESQQAAAFVLDRIDAITTQKDMVQMLVDMAQKWSIFQEIVDIERGKEERQEEVAAAANIAQMIKIGQVNQALHTARKIIED